MILTKLSDIFEKPISGEWGIEAANSEGVKVIRTTNFTNTGKLDLDKGVAVRKINKSIIAQKKLIPGDIIIEKSGGSPIQPVGRVVFFDINNDTYLCNNFTSILRAKQHSFPKYLLYTMLYLYKLNIVSKYQNKTTGIINFKLNDYLQNIEINFPPIETQKKIAEVLDKAQELIDKRKEQIALLDDFIQSVFIDMFGDPVSNPKGWNEIKVENVCKSIVGGGTPSKNNSNYYNGEIPWVTPKDMKSRYIRDSIDHITKDAVLNSSVKMIPPDSILMVIRSGILKRYIPIAINKCEVTVNQDMKAFIVDAEIATVQYLMFALVLLQSLLLKHVRGVTADNIEFSLIKELLIPLPPLDLQNQFAQIVEKTEQQRELLEKSLSEMENNFNSIMQRAFRGELF